jgi:AsmA protein
LQDTRAGAATIKSASTHAVLHAGHLVLDPLAIDLPGGHIDATVMADASGAAALTLRAPSLSIQPMLAGFDEPDGVLGTLEVRADLHGSGATPHALAAGLDGSVGFALANGEIDNRLLVALLSRLAPEAGLLDLAGKPGRSALRCVAVRADVAHGVADLHALLLDTVPLRLTGGGTLDLAQETLSLHLLPLARIGGTGLTVPVNVRGSLRAPRAAVDAAGAGKSLGGLVIGALGADRLIAGAGQSDGCADQLQLARFGDPGPVPEALPAQAASKPAPPNLNNLLKQLLR